MCAGVSSTSLIVFGVQPATPTSTLFPPPLCASSNSTADVFLFKSLTSTVLVLLVLRRGRDGVSRACIAQHGRSGSATAYEGSGAMIDVIAADPTVLIEEYTKGPRLASAGPIAMRPMKVSETWIEDAHRGSSLRRRAGALRVHLLVQYQPEGKITHPTHLHNVQKSVELSALPAGQR